MPHRPFVQLAYHVPDIFEAAERWAAERGAGPFYINEHIPIERAIYRGQPGEFDHSSAYGQLGSVMLELVQQNNDGPSAIRDMYAPDEQGLHHCATIVPNFEEELARYEALGFTIANRFVLAGGMEFGFVDTVAVYGHMVEVYEGLPGLLDFYALIAAAAEGWDGADPIRRVADMNRSPATGPNPA